MKGKSMGKKNTISLVLVTITVLLSQSLWADAEDRRQAKRIHDRLTGVPATNAVIDDMETLLTGTAVGIYPGDTSGKSAAQYAIDTAVNPNAHNFYNVTLKNFAAPWTNEEQTVFTDLNDYTATVIGTIRDDLDFRRILYDDILYIGNNTPAYSNSNNLHYEALEDRDPHPTAPNSGNLADPLILQATTQSAVTGLDTGATAGIMTSRAGAMAFYSDGTNRAMFRFTMMNHLCTDLEPLKDVSRTPNRVRQDVSRSPGGDSRIFLNSCVGCHAGMDGMAGAFAYYEWDYANDKTNGNLVYTGPPAFTPGVVSGKHLINPDNFEPGYVMSDDSWVNYWRNGQNWLLGWGTAVNPDTKGNETGNGAKALGQELANSDAFARCQVDKVFENVCLRGPTDFHAQDRAVRDGIVADFKTTYNYNMRDVFTDVAAHCKGN
jgi:hypothetical protein